MANDLSVALINIAVRYPEASGHGEHIPANHAQHISSYERTESQKMTASNHRDTTPAQDQMIKVHSTDRAGLSYAVAMTFLSLHFILTTVYCIQHERTFWAFGAGGGALMWGLQAMVWFAKYRVDAVVGSESVTRTGRFGWRLTHDMVSSCTVADTKSILGKQPCLLLKLRPQAATGRLRNQMNSSRMARWGGLDRMTMVLPLDEPAAEAIAAIGIVKTR